MKIQLFQFLFNACKQTASDEAYKGFFFTDFLLLDVVAMNLICFNYK